MLDFYLESTFAINIVLIATQHKGRFRKKLRVILWHSIDMQQRIHCSNIMFTLPLCLHCHYVYIAIMLTLPPFLNYSKPYYNFPYLAINLGPTGRGSSIGSEIAWHASGPEFDSHVWHIFSWRLGHENISTTILPLPLIQEEQLPVTGKRMCTKYW